jgi:hypothetical protein
MRIFQSSQLTGIEEKTAAYGADDGLRKKNLVVFLRDGCHHQAEDMQERADSEGYSWTVVVCHFANNRSPEEHHE